MVQVSEVYIYMLLFQTALLVFYFVLFIYILFWDLTWTPGGFSDSVPVRDSLDHHPIYTYTHPE